MTTFRLKTNDSCSALWFIEPIPPLTSLNDKYPLLLVQHD